MLVKVGALSLKKLLELRFDLFEGSGIIEKLWLTKGNTKSPNKSNAASSHVNTKQKYSDS